jgi:hypothetical protein
VAREEETLDAHRRGQNSGDQKDCVEELTSKAHVPTPSMPEVPASREHHREATLVGGSDHVLIAN